MRPSSSRRTSMQRMAGRLAVAVATLVAWPAAADWQRDALSGSVAATSENTVVVSAIDGSGAVAVRGRLVLQPASPAVRAWLALQIDDGGPVLADCNAAAMCRMTVQRDAAPAIEQFGCHADGPYATLGGVRFASSRQLLMQLTGGDGRLIVTAPISDGSGGRLARFQFRIGALPALGRGDDRGCDGDGDEG